MVGGERVVVAIPTCGRPGRLRMAVEHFDASNEPVDIVVWDSVPNDANRALAEECGNVTLHESHRMTGPAESRFRLGELVDAELVLFADDDCFPRPETVGTMVDLMDRYPQVEVLGARLERDGQSNEVAQRLQFGARHGRRTVRKTFTRQEELDELELELIEADITMPTMLLRQEVLRRVSFDPRYNFFFDLYDFGMQCRAASVAVYGTHLAVFDHVPGGYGATETKRKMPRSEDRQRFIDKWGVEPVGATGGGRR